MVDHRVDILKEQLHTEAHRDILASDDGPEHP
jgi:hypothetical protein